MSVLPLLFVSERIGFACCLGFLDRPFPSWAKFYVLNQRSLVCMIDLISQGSKELRSSGSTLWPRMSWKDPTRSKSFSVILYFLFWDCNIMVWSNRVPEASVSGCFSFTRGGESPARAAVEFPIRGVCCNTSTFEAVVRAVMDSSSSMAFSDSVRAGLM